MGKRGPKPQPTVIARIRGTYRADRHGPKTNATASRPLARVPRPPAYLGATAKAEWTRLAKLLHAMRIITPQDLPELEAFAIARGRAIDAEAVLAREGRTIATPQGPKRHPELLTAEKSWADARRYAELFGLSPSARRSLGVQEPPAEDVNPFDDIEKYFGGAR